MVYDHDADMEDDDFDYAAAFDFMAKMPSRALCSQLRLRSAPPVHGFSAHFSCWSC